MDGGKFRKGVEGGGRGRVLASVISFHCVMHMRTYVGNYLQMMNVLRTIGFDVLECLSQLYDYYLYAVSC